MINQSSFELFFFPLPESRDTHYHTLDITPEATIAEIREAKREARSRLNREKRVIEKKLELIYKELPELSHLYSEIKSVREKGNETENDKLVKLERQLKNLEQKAILINPDYQLLREKTSEIENKIYKINRINLENPDERLCYDKSTPPCALLKLESCDHEIFTTEGRKIALFLLRQEIIDFMEKKGEHIYHPSDITRNNFISDFTINPIIDGESNAKTKKEEFENKS